MPDELFGLMDGAVVFHLISCCRPSSSTAGAADEVMLDVAATLRYLEATKTSDVRWIFLSSGGTVYGDNEAGPNKESQRPEPICTYGLIKATMEEYFRLYRHLHGTDYVIARLSNPYGPGQDPLRGQGIIPSLLYKALKGIPIEIWGDGSNIRDYLYVSDAMEAILAAAVAGRPGEIYNIGSGSGVSIAELVEKVKQVVPGEVRVQHVPARSVDVRCNILDAAKFFEDTGWQPKVSMDVGIRRTLEWLSGYQA
jgi:UDP-glucose 4-epimerase